MNKYIIAIMQQVAAATGAYLVAPDATYAFGIYLLAYALMPCIK